MTKKLLILVSLLLMILVACSGQGSEQNAPAVAGEAIVIDVYRAPT